MKNPLLIGTILIGFWGNGFAQTTSFTHTEPNKLPEDHTQISPERVYWVAGGHILLFAGTLFTLDYLWYRDYPRSSFHFFNDLPDWKQMDKGGHAVSAYHFSKNSYRTFRWAGLSENNAALWGAISGNVLLTSIEILDGFSAEWGASVSDLAANAVGSMAFYLQQKKWSEQRIHLKYSYTSNEVAQYRPDLLGSSLPERLIKDYNGITYWVSFNPGLFFQSKTQWPPWLNLALGYGAWGMMGSRQNPAFYQGSPLPDFARYRQFYLSPDIDLSRLPIRSETLKTIVTTLNFLKFPAPALEYNPEKGFVFHWFFF